MSARVFTWWSTTLRRPFRSDVPAQGAPAFIPHPEPTGTQQQPRPSGGSAGGNHPEVTERVQRSSPGRSRAKRPRIGTAGRLAAFHALIIATVLGIVVIQFTQTFANRYRTTITRDLSENVTSFTQMAANRPSDQSLAAFTRSFLANRGPIAGDVLVISLPSRHLLLGTSESAQLSKIPKIAALLAHPPNATVVTQVSIGDTPEEVLVTRIEQGGIPVGTFVTAGSLVGYEHVRTRVLDLAAGEGLITLLAAVVSVYIILRRLLGSVRRLTRTAGDIGLRGELGIRLGDAQTGDEVGEMAATFDAMIEKIDTSVAQQRQMLADVSHQLRTPLTVARGHLEVMSRGSLDDPTEVRETVTTVVDELDHMKQLVERLLLLGRSLEADFVELGPVDLRAMLYDIGDAVEMLAPRHWSVGPVPDVVLVADLEKLRGAILNLVDNAVHATRPADSIRLSAHLGNTDDPTLDVIVDDSGPGIAPPDRTAVLERFSRPSATDTRGSGLGLAIVEAVAVAHNGTVAIDDSPLGGCRVIITLPLPGPDTDPTVLEEKRPDANPRR